MSEPFRIGRPCKASKRNRGHTASGRRVPRFRVMSCNAEAAQQRLDQAADKAEDVLEKALEVGKEAAQIW